MSDAGFDARASDAIFDALEQTVIECAAQGSTGRSTGEAEEVLFVVAGAGTLRAAGTSHPLEPETGAYLAPGEVYSLENQGTEPLRVVSVQIPDPEPNIEPHPPKVVVRRVADQEDQPASTDRWFRIVADPGTGLRSATQFVGYIPTARAPDHFHLYDEVIYIIEGIGVFHAGGTRRPVGPGSTIELPARKVHCLENTGERLMRLVAVFRPAGSPAAAYHPDGAPAYPGAPPIES